MESAKTPLLTGKEGEDFDLHLSAEWIKNHTDRHPHEPHSHFFGKEILQKILNQDGCVGIRFYHAHSEPKGSDKGDRHIIIVGARADGSDMTNTKDAKPDPLSREEMKAVAYDTVGQQSMPCPGSPGCPKSFMA
ncbi:MAG TPA: hypothetical protein VIM55_13425 [Mucilaginibacter sp.]